MNSYINCLMKRNVCGILFIVALSAISSIHCQAQSLKDLFNKENIEKVVNAVTNNTNINMEGTWTLTGSAIEFETDDLLKKAGGALATQALEEKLDEQLSKIGITAGKLSFTFNADSTFNRIGLAEYIPSAPSLFSRLSATRQFSILLLWAKNCVEQGDLDQARFIAGYLSAIGYSRPDIEKTQRTLKKKQGQEKRGGRP